MRRLVVMGFLAVAAAAGAYAWSNYRLEVHRGEGGIESITVLPVAGGSAEGRPSSGSADGAPRPAIRIATFNLDPLDEQKLGDPQTGAVLARVVARFDVVAVQGLRGGDARFVQQLVDRINADGGQYDFAVRPVAAQSSGRDVAILFDRKSIEIDRSTIRSVGDPERRFLAPPLAALFRVKGPDPGEAFTFALVNVQTDPGAEGPRELIEEVFRAVRDDLREEDDVIVLGDLGADAEARWGARITLTSAVLDTPTTLEGKRPTDNLLFDRQATTEFTGRAGVLDLMREYDLTWREVSAISGHLPVWAEFGSREGYAPAHVAGRTDPSSR